MAFPVVSATNTSAVSTAGTTHTVNLPTGIASGDLLIVFFSKKSGSSNTLTWPSGWTALTDVNNGTNTGQSTAYRIADGTEGTTISVTSSASVKSAHNSYRITSWHGTTPPEGGAGSTGSSANPDPPSVSPSWGSADNLFLEAASVGSNTSSSAASTNYTNLLTINSTGGSGGSNQMQASARHSLTGSTDDPDNAFTISASSIWASQTIAIRPAGAAFDPSTIMGPLALMDSGGFVGSRYV